MDRAHRARWSHFTIFSAAISVTTLASIGCERGTQYFNGRSGIQRAGQNSDLDPSSITIRPEAVSTPKRDSSAIESNSPNSEPANPKIIKLALVASSNSPKVFEPFTLRVEAMLSDESVYDASNQCSWSIPSRSMQQSSSIQSQFMISEVGSSKIGCTIDGVKAELELNAASRTITKFELQELTDVFKVGEQIRAKAKVWFEDQSEPLDVTAFATWTSSQQSVADVTGLIPGEFKVMSEGLGQIEARILGESVSQSFSAVLKDYKSLELIPTTITMVKGTSYLVDGVTVDLNGFAERSNQVVFFSSESGPGIEIADHDRIVAKDPGVYVVKGEVGDLSSQLMVNVVDADLINVETSVDSGKLAINTSAPLRVTGIFLTKDLDIIRQDISRDVRIQSSNSSLLKIETGSEVSKINALAVGTSTLTFQLQGKSIQKSIQIHNSELANLRIALSNEQLAPGAEITAKVIATYMNGSIQDVSDSAEWAMSDVSRTQISNSSDETLLVRALSTGSSMLSASFAGMSAERSLQVTAAPVSTMRVELLVSPEIRRLEVGASTTYSLRARVVGTTNEIAVDDVDWSTSTPNLISVSSQGVVRALAQGAAMVSATINLAGAEVSTSASLEVGNGGFTAFSACSVTCGGGRKTRVCTLPSLLNGDSACVGATTAACNTQNCPIDGGWSAFSGWSSCSRSCGGGVQSRSRSCNNPVPQFGGDMCVGASSESRSCNTQACYVAQDSFRAAAKNVYRRSVVQSGAWTFFFSRDLHEAETFFTNYEGVVFRGVPANSDDSCHDGGVAIFRYSNAGSPLVFRYGRLSEFTKFTSDGFGRLDGAAFCLGPNSTYGSPVYRWIGGNGTHRDSILTTDANYFPDRYFGRDIIGYAP